MLVLHGGLANATHKGYLSSSPVAFGHHQRSSRVASDSLPRHVAEHIRPVMLLPLSNEAVLYYFGRFVRGMYQQKATVRKMNYAISQSLELLLTGEHPSQVIHPIPRAVRVPPHLAGVCYFSWKLPAVVSARSLVRDALQSPQGSQCEPSNSSSTWPHLQSNGVNFTAGRVEYPGTRV